MRAPRGSTGLVNVNVLNRIGDFLSERKQRVKIKGYASEWINVSSAWSTAGQRSGSLTFYSLY